jgi:hypothetical protein
MNTTSEPDPPGPTPPPIGDADVETKRADEADAARQKAERERDGLKRERDDFKRQAEEAEVRTTVADAARQQAEQERDGLRRERDGFKRRAEEAEVRATAGETRAQAAETEVSRWRGSSTSWEGRARSAKTLTDAAEASHQATRDRAATEIAQLRAEVDRVQRQASIEIADIKRQAADEIAKANARSDDRLRAQPHWIRELAPVAGLGAFLGGAAAVWSVHHPIVTAVDKLAFAVSGSPVLGHTFATGFTTDKVLPIGVEIVFGLVAGFMCRRVVRGAMMIDNDPAMTRNHRKRAAAGILGLSIFAGIAGGIVWGINNYLPTGRTPTSTVGQQNTPLIGGKLTTICPASIVLDNDGKKYTVGKTRPETFSIDDQTGNQVHVIGSPNVDNGWMPITACVRIERPAGASGIVPTP